MSFIEPFQDNDLMPFGKHKGKALVNIPAFYLIYIYENDMVYDLRVKKYIANNLDTLKKEAGKAKRR
jgi:uncharacterized protein (DUF3820 family)